MASLASDAETSHEVQGGTSQKRKSSKYGTLARNDAAVAKRIATTRLNSTSTLFVDSTLAQPNNRTTIRAVAEQISKQIVGPFPDGEGDTLFDEPTSSQRPRRRPTTGETEYVIRHVFKTGQLSVDCNIIALVYLDRLRVAGVQVTPSNWRPLLCVCLMLASKIWDDLSMINEDFSTFLPFSLAQLNKWEMSFLNVVSFNVRVKASEYAKYYFNLRQQQQQEGLAGSGGSSSSGGGGGSDGASKQHAGEQPLDMEGAHRLEALSVSAQSRFEALYGAVPDSSGSVYNLKSAPDTSHVTPNRLTRSISDPSSISGGKVKSKAMAVLS
jgi:hypothetical protein